MVPFERDDIHDRGTTSEEFPISFPLDESAYHLEPVAGEGVEGKIVEATGTLRVTRRGEGRACSDWPR